MLDSMMSSSERERFNKRHDESRANAQVNNNAIAVALAFSKALRRLWVWGTLSVIILACLVLVLESKKIIPGENDFMTLVKLGIVFILPLWVLWAIYIWCKAHF